MICLILWLCGEHRNELKACEHYRRHLLMWALAVWHLYVMTVQRKREMEQARQTTQNKMAAFLNAAASGQLWTDRTCKAASDESEVPCAIDAVAADVPTVWFIASNLNYHFIIIAVHFSIL